MSLNTNISPSQGALRFTFIIIAGLLIAGPAFSGETTYVISTPSQDQWQYPFNFSPGLETDRSVFAATSAPFDGRDSLALIRWNTSGVIAPGSGVENYHPSRLSIRFWDIATSAWVVTSTRVVQVFGVGYGPTYTESAWTETGAIIANGAGAPVQRDPYPVKLDGTRAENDLSAQPWAAGVPDPTTSHPRATRFDLDLFHPAIRAYVKEGLNKGSLTFAISSTFIPMGQGASADLPRIVFKEGVASHAGASAPELSITLKDAPAGGEFLFDQPSADLWQYPFNATPGSCASAPLFTGGDPFDYRDGEMLVAFDTSSQIPTGLGMEGYEVESCVIRAWNLQNAGWDLRGTTHEIEIWGTGFGPTYTADTWTESSAIKAGGPGGSVQRDPFPMQKNGARAEDDPMAEPWAAGRILGYNPGAQGSPFLIQFDLDASDSSIAEYLAEGLDRGRLFFHLATNRPSGSSNPNLVMKEGITGQAAGISGGPAEAPELRLTVKTTPASDVANWSLY